MRSPFLGRLVFLRAWTRNAGASRFPAAHFTDTSPFAWIVAIMGNRNRRDARRRHRVAGQSLWLATTVDIFRVNTHEAQSSARTPRGKCSAAVPQRS